MTSFSFKKKMDAGLREKVMVSLCAKRRHTAKVADKQPKLVVSSASVRPACLPACRCRSAGALIPIKGIYV